MSVETEPHAPLVKYSPTEQEIAALAQEVETNLATLDPGTPARYDALRVEIAKTRTFRGDIERERVRLKAESLAYGRAVDAGAKLLTGRLLAIEDPMRREKEAVDAEKEAAARAIVLVEQARLKAMEDAERMAKEAEFEAQRKAIADERAALDAERKAQEASLAAARQEEETKFKEEQAKARYIQEKLEAARKVEQDRFEAEKMAMEAERRGVEEEKRLIEQAKRRELERLDRIEYEKAAMAKLEATVTARRKREIEEAEAKRKADEAEAARMEAAKPDVQKVQQLGRELRALGMPKVTNQKAVELLAVVQSELETLAARCLSFKVNGRKS